MNRLRTGLLVVSIVACHVYVSALKSHAEDWPQFLGPQRSGVSTDSVKLIDSFSEQGPKIVWRSPGGVGMSGIAVANGKCFMLANREQHQVLLAFDRATGKELWSQPLAPAYSNQMGNGPRATPTVSGENVFTFTGEGILSCNNATDGKLRWQCNPLKELGGKPSEYGMSCSPLIVDNLVVVQAGAEKGTVIAVDAATGKTVWAAGSGRAGYSSPALLSINGEQQLIAFSGNQCLAMNPKTGAELWSYPFVTDYDCNTATPIAVDGKVLISSGENHGSVLLAVSQAGGKWSVKEAWSSLGTGAALRSEWQTPLLSGKLLFGFDNVGSAGPVTNLTCLDAATGKVLWKEMRFGKSNGILADGKLVIVNMEGELILVRATGDSFKQLASARVLGKTRQAPSISGGFVFLRDDAEVVCIDLRKK